MEKYDGKTVHYKAMVSGIGKMPKNIFIPGRFIMACCENDIGFAGLICECHGCEKMQNRAWIDLTAKIKIKYHPIYRNKGPVLTAISIKPAKPAAQEVATFY